MVQRPTLYIEKSNTDLPFAPMQREFHSMKQSETEQHPKKINKSEFKTKETGNQASTEKLNKKPQQTFNQMTTEEKVDYLLPTSKYLPAIHCKLTINQAYYRGRILAREEDQFVFEERPTRKRHLFKLSEVTDLRMIGF